MITLIQVSGGLGCLLPPLVALDYTLSRRAKRAYQQCAADRAAALDAGFRPWQAGRGRSRAATGCGHRA
jgi:hypothetical protein